MRDDARRLLCLCPHDYLLREQKLLREQPERGEQHRRAVLQSDFYVFAGLSCAGDAHLQPQRIQLRRGKRSGKRTRGIVGHGGGAGGRTGGMHDHDLVPHEKTDLHAEQNHQHQDGEQQRQLQGGLTSLMRFRADGEGQALQVMRLVMERITALKKLPMRLVSVAQATNNMARAAAPRITKAYSAVA